MALADAQVLDRGARVGRRDRAQRMARILPLLLRGGPQPSVDVRTGGPIGMVSSPLIAGGLAMIGPRAGVRYFDEAPA